VQNRNGDRFPPFTPLLLLLLSAFPFEQGTFCPEGTIALLSLGRVGTDGRSRTILRVRCCGEGW
jgi:hypothetical protein